jgi:membrane fusion protein (multidrug efflux system)
MLKNIQKNFSIKSTLKMGPLLFIASAAVFLSACSKEEVKRKTPPPAISVYTIKTDEIGGYREFVARTVASKEANLRARVEGELLERHFREGSIVKRGQVLLKIDPSSYNATLSSAKADLISKIAGAETAARDLKRGKEIVADGFISQSDLDKLKNNAAQAIAAVKVVEATLQKAELDVSYTTITAPFTGRIGKVNYNVGNVVGPTSDALATLILTDPMHVSFQVEESEFITYLQDHRVDGKQNSIDADISMRLPNNTLYNQSGKLDFADTKIEQSMGTVELRAVFDNPDGIILPGLFVTLIIESKKKEKMALIPQAAVQENQQGKFVLVVDDKNTVSSRHVTLGRRINAMWVVTSGIKTGENVVIEGLQKVRAGVEVKAVVKSVDPLTGTIAELINTEIQTSESSNKG